MTVAQAKEAAEKRDAEGQFLLARAYANGSGVAKDLNKAVELYKLSAAQNNFKAQNNLGVLYLTGLA